MEDRVIQGIQHGEPQRDAGGWLPLEGYAALGDGRSVALVGWDGSIDWWCVPHMDSPPLFDRLLAPQHGGYFAITPTQAYRVERRYLPGSNVLETLFITDSGRVRLVESLNSGPAGRLPWGELGRRLEGVEGQVDFAVKIDFGTQADTVSPFLAPTGNGCVFHAGHILGMFIYSEQLQIQRKDDLGVRAEVRVATGDKVVMAIVCGRDEPLVVPSLELIDARIDGSHREWLQWSECLSYDGPYQTLVVRSALALKLLLSSPTGAIMAAATTSLPERIGGTKNYDYRFAWVRDAGYIIEAFLTMGAQPEAKAALTWLLHRLSEHGVRVFYTLQGEVGEGARALPLPGYKYSPPVVGNNATAAGVTFTLGGTPGAGDQFSIQSNNHQTQNVLDTLGQMVTALNLPVDGDPVVKQQFQGAMESALSNIDSASNQIGAAVTSIGARGQSLDDQDTTNQSLIQANTTTQGSIRDSDPAEVMTRLTLQQTMLQASQLAFSKISQLGLFNKI